MKAAKHLLRYVKRTGNLGLRLGRFTTKDLYPVLYSDADWARDLDTRKSTGGYLCILTGGLSQGEPIQSVVSWSSKRQRTVALSSTEAEYMALTQAAKEAIWVSRFLAELQGICPPENSGILDPARDPTEELSRSASRARLPATKIFVDNQSAIALSRNPEFHARTKHIAIQEHYARAKVARGR